MRMIIDVREHDLIEKCTLSITNNPNYVTIETQALHIGDILFKTDEGKDVLLVERKTLQDLIASVKDGRYEEQSHRLKHASGFSPHNVFYLIEGMFSSLRTPLEKKLVMSAMASLSYFKGFSVFRTSGLQETTDVLIHMADKIDRNFMKGILPWYLSSPGEQMVATDTTGATVEPYSGLVKKVKKENITPDNMGEILLCQIPGISSQYAQAILKHFAQLRVADTQSITPSLETGVSNEKMCNGFSAMLAKVKEGTADFENISYETKGKQRRIPKSCGEEIRRYFQGI